jgi:two-component system sensor histidine kinase/response regulator
MMSEAKKRQAHTPEFKAKVGLEALRGVKTIDEIGQEYGVHPVQVGQWKKEIEEQAKTLFEGKREPRPMAAHREPELLRIDDILYDVTGCRQQEEQLKAREQQFRNLVETIPGITFQCLPDEDWTMLFISDEVERLSGYPASDFIHNKARTFASLIHPDDVQYVEDAVGQAVKHRHAYTVEYRIVDRNGHLHFVYEQGKATYADDGTPTSLFGTVIDISARKKAEEALRKSEERYFLVMRGTNDGFWDWDYLTDEIYFSPRYKEMLDYRPDEFPDHIDEWWKRIHPDDMDLVMAATMPCVKGERDSFRVEYRMQHKDGHWVWVMDRGANIKDKTGRVVRLAGTKTDISERKQMEASLAAERQQLQNILDNSQLGVTFTSKGIIRFANPKFREMFDLHVGDPAVNFYVDPEERAAIVARLASHGRVENYELQAYDRQGLVRDMLINYMSFTYQGEEGILGWLLDISERKASEKRLQESEARLEAVTRGANLGMWDYLPQQGEAFANQTLATMLGYDPRLILETTAKWSRVSRGIEIWSDLIHPDDLAAASELFMQHLQGKTDFFRAEFRLRCADGSWKWILSAGQVVERDSAGRALRMTGIHADIDELKKLQQELKMAKDTAEKATEAKSNFLANMSHEIRTPLNAIIGLSHLALQTELNPKQRNYIDKTNRSAESLLGIINDILDFSKIEAGKLEVEHIDFRLEEVFDHLANLVDLKAEEKRLELVFDLPPDLPTALIGDPLRLGQILVNLGNNAVKFTEQGEVVIGVETVEQDDKEIKLHFTVRDTGVGMPPEEQGKLFRSFSQADTSTTRRYGGTGLGLVISKKLTELMGGEIWCASEEGVGSTFHFTVQLSKQPDKISSRFSVVPTKLRALRVLVVDDNSSAREILASMLAFFGLRVDQAGSGEAALALLEEANDDDPYNLVIMDWMMPGMDGIETIRAIQSDTLLSEVPTVIMITAYGHKEVSQSAAEINISSFLTKPVTPSTLLEAIMPAMSYETADFGRVNSRREAVKAVVASLRDARVLLVEDNEINQELALELLTANGIIAEVANNGQQALELLEKEQFDGVLMDCQMPVMDGYEATRRLRRQERFKDLPVLAMTANAMAGDRERALAAGMNDHIAKPINVHKMFTTMAKWITPSLPLEAAATADTEKAGVEADIPVLPGIDTAAGLARCMGDRRLYRKILQMFRDNNADFSEQFRKAQASDDPQAATRCAHSLKGVAGTIGAQAVQKAAEALESGCREEAGQEQVDQLLDAVLSELSLALAGLQALKYTSATSLI